MSGIGALRAATTLALWAAAWQGGAERGRGARRHRRRRSPRRGSCGDRRDRRGNRASRAGLAERRVRRRCCRCCATAGGRSCCCHGPGTCAACRSAGSIAVAALDAGAVVRLPAIDIGLVPSNGQWRAYRCRRRASGAEPGRGARPAGRRGRPGDPVHDRAGRRAQLRDRQGAGPADDAGRGGQLPARHAVGGVGPAGHVDLAARLARAWPTARTPRPSPATRWRPSTTCCARWRSRSGRARRAAVAAAVGVP